MIDFIKELPQNTAVIQSEHMEQYSKSSNEQHHLEAAFDIRGATCISDAVFITIIITIKLNIHRQTCYWHNQPKCRICSSTMPGSLDSW